ncbi:terminase [Escherichia coli]|nr:terminase [Escherichia coli]
MIFEHPPEMVESGTHLLMENLAMVNPNLGYSVDEAFLYREYRKAGRLVRKHFVASCQNMPMWKLVLPCVLTAGRVRISGSRRVSLDDILQRADVVTVGIDGGGMICWECT